MAAGGIDAPTGQLALVYDAKEGLSQALGEFICSVAAQSISERGEFVVAVSGGSLIQILTSGLEQVAQSRTLQLPKWTVVAADERLVPLTDPESNVGAFQRAMTAANIEGHRDVTYLEVDPSAGDGDVDLVAAAYAADLGDRRIDLALLGMGPDGHTASLFPGHSLLSEASLMVAGIADSPKPPPRRVTLTLRALNAARHVAFVVSGAGKAAAVAASLGDETDRPPAGLVRPASKNLRWLLDAPASRQLKGWQSGGSSGAALSATLDQLTKR